MRRSFSLALATGALALGFVASSAQAAPLTSPPADFKTAAGENSGIEQVSHRCYRHRGHWHCPRHRYYRYDEPSFRFYYGPRRHYHRRHWHY